MDINAVVKRGTSLRSRARLTPHSLSLENPFIYLELWLCIYSRRGISEDEFTFFNELSDASAKKQIV